MKGSDTEVFRPCSEFILSHFDQLRACPEFIEGTGWAEGLSATTRINSQGYQAIHVLDLLYLSFSLTLGWDKQSSFGYLTSRTNPQRVLSRRY